jgi:hypothetical protein
MVWGMLPDLYKNVSWESHMLGFISGIILSVWYRNEGPQRPVYDWLDEEDVEGPTSPRLRLKRLKELKNPGKMIVQKLPGKIKPSTINYYF